MEGIKAKNFAITAARNIFNRIDDDISQLKSSGVVKINLHNNGTGKSHEDRIVYSSKHCNNYTAYAKDFTIHFIYQNIVQILQTNLIIPEQDWEDKVLTGNFLIAAIDLVVKYIHMYVKTMSTRSLNAKAQSTVNLLCRDQQDDGSILQGIQEALSAGLSSDTPDILLDYDPNELSAGCGNLIRKLPIYGLMGNLSQEIDRQKHMFMRYEIQHKQMY